MNLLEQIRPETSVSNAFSKTILSAGELNGTLTLLGAGAENTAPGLVVERVLFLAQGSITVTVDAVKYVLETDHTLVIASGKSYSVRNHGDSPARIFTLALPSHKGSEPPMVVLS